MNYLHLEARMTAMQKITGRKTEIATIQKILASDRPAFVALYGRRRIGKTFLVKQLLSEHFVFYMTGVDHTTNKKQLSTFKVNMDRHFQSDVDWEIPNDWFAAFEQLRTAIEKAPNTASKKVIFLDELPWFDKPKSGFVSALEYFWNSWASTRDDLMLVVCGSAASWMINTLINHRGGLHNRLTHRMALEPFTLAECAQFFEARGATYKPYQLLQLYMVTGGIPFYLDEVDISASIAQNIDRMCFTHQGLLHKEFDNLFASLYRRPENHLRIIETLASKMSGMSRTELIERARMTNGGHLTKTLNELEESGFIRKYKYFGNKSRLASYRLSDFYSAFYLRFIKNADRLDDNSWLDQLDHPAIRAWSGHAFEQVCLSHVPQIKQALGIASVRTSVSTWQGTDGDRNAQIDLVIDRRDQVVHLCEIKFAQDTYTITKEYADQLRRKRSVFETATGTRKALFLTMITTFGLTANSYASDLVVKSLRLEDLFWGE
jgi:uncharacterized protein